MKSPIPFNFWYLCFMSRKIFLLAAALGFLMVLIAAYFGSSIQNAKTNDPISYLNEMDHIHYYNAALIPQLNYRAALVTLPFVLLLSLVEFWILFKTPFRIPRNISIGLLVACGLLIVISFLTLHNPSGYDYSKWGYVWMAMGLFIVAGNILSGLIKKETVRK